MVWFTPYLIQIDTDPFTFAACYSLLNKKISTINKQSRGFFSLVMQKN